MFEPIKNDLLRAARGLLGLSQAEFAHAAGIDRRTLIGLENDTAKKNASLDIRRKIYLAFDDLGIEIFPTGVRWKSPDSNTKRHASVIRGARLLVGISQTELSQRSGLDRQSIVRMESGKLARVDLHKEAALIDTFLKLGVVLNFGTAQQVAEVRWRIPDALADQ